MDEEEMMVWQDVLDEIQAGRAEGLSCPFCRTGKLLVESVVEGRAGGLTKITCQQCKKYIEGRFGE